MRPGFFLQIAHYLVHSLGNHLELLTDLLGGFSGGESSQYDRFFEIERRVRPDKGGLTRVRRRTGRRRVVPIPAFCLRFVIHGLAPPGTQK